MRVLIIFFGLLMSLSIHSENKNPFIFNEVEIKDTPLEREQYFIDQRAYPFNEIPKDARIKAFRQLDRMKNNKNSSTILGQTPEWINIGPFNVGGRVKSIAPHPTQKEIVYIGAAAGGIWKSTDGGDNWNPIFDFENAISFGSISIDEKNPSNIYAATGEAVMGGGNIYLGSGVYKSTNAGIDWVNIGLTDVGAFSKIICHPKNSNLIYAGGVMRGQGLYKSTDAGKSWSKMYSGPVTDVSVNPDNENELMFGINGVGILYSDDGGVTNQERIAGIETGIGRVSVQQAGSKPSTAYALMEISSNGYIYKTTNNGLVWTLVYKGSSSFFNGQGFYDNFICVNPTNPNHAVAGGIDVFITTDGGGSWINTTRSYSGGNVHPDQQCGAFSLAGEYFLYLGNDGGMYRSIDGGINWTETNNNLQITQFYSLAIDHKSQTANYGGTQDNGTLGTQDKTSWSSIYGGDGFQTLVDNEDSEVIYGEVATVTSSGTRIYPWKRDLGTGSYSLINNGLPSTDASGWNPPLVQDYNMNYILYHGRTKLYASYNNGVNWDPIATASSGYFTSIEPSKASSDIIFAGTNVGQVIVSTDGGGEWDNITENGLVNRFVTDIESSWKNDGTFYITFSGYGTPHIFKTTNYGKNWKVVSNGLPDIPVNALAIQPDNENRLFAATDIGVFASFDDGETWFPYGRNLPRSPVVDIAFHRNKVVLPQRTLRIATHGRSMWEIDVTDEIPIDPAIVSPTGGEIFYSATNQYISWFGFSLPVSVYWSYNNGETWNMIAEKVSGNSMLWTVPNYPTFNARIKIVSTIDKNQEKISNSFTVKLTEKGSVMKNSSVSFIPYGLAWDGKNGLWVTSFQTKQLYKLNSETFYKEKSVNLPGDSLFTDLTYDKQNHVIYLHRMNSTTSGGGTIYKVDTNGVELKRFPSPAKYYPIGLELVDGKLIVGDRDTKRYLYVVNPETGAVEREYQNPFNITYGPRGLCYDGTDALYQVSTSFPGAGSLTAAYIIKINKNDLSKEVDRFSLESLDGLINGRGIDYDYRDQNFWVSDYGGNIYKIAGFNTIAEVKEEIKKENIEISCYPNPAKEYLNVGFRSMNSGEYEISLISLLNESTGIKFNVNLDLGDDFSKTISLNNLSSGAYYLIIKKDNLIFSREKVIIIK